MEQVIRRDRMGISELSRKLHVSRRTIYNWFDQEYLDPEIIWKVGVVIGHNFSEDFANAFSDDNARVETLLDRAEQSDQNSVRFWMNKYITLLEEYNNFLSLSLPQSISSRLTPNPGDFEDEDDRKIKPLPLKKA